MFSNMFIKVLICGTVDGNKNSSITIETQVVQKLRNNEPRPKVTGSYKKKKEACIMP